MVTQGATTDMPVAAASKAIIQRDIRNAAVIYDVSSVPYLLAILARFMLALLISYQWRFFHCRVSIRIKIHSKKLRTRSWKCIVVKLN